MSVHTACDNAAIVCWCSASLSHPRLCCVTLDRCLGFRLRRARFTQQTGVRQGPVRPGDTNDVQQRRFGLELEVSRLILSTGGGGGGGVGLQLHIILSY